MKLVQVDGRTKIVLRGRISEYIPNPTFEVVAAPGSGMEYFAGRNDSGKSFREIVQPMRAVPEFSDRYVWVDLIDRMHIDAILNFPTLASAIEVNFMDDPVLTARSLAPRVQPVDVRRVGLRPSTAASSRPRS